MKDKLAQLIRVITVPPVLALSMLVILWCVFGDLFASIPALLGAILFLAVIPVCAYPAAALKQGKEDDTRSRQRKLAFVFTFFGYAGALILSVITSRGQMLLTVTSAYFIAVLLLTLLNKVLHIKASGHACSCVLPFLFLIYWLGPKAAVLCALIYLAELWASVSLKRHTVREFLTGSATALVTFACVWGKMLR